jgi:signal transduction histidine kinase
MFRWINRLDHHSRGLFVVAALAIVVTVGVVDYATGREISFSVFYLLAVALATWFVGRGFAFFISFLSVTVSLAGDMAAGARYSNPLVLCWNGAILLAFYLIVVWLLARLRLLYKELEARVLHRTAALTEEMAERERLERELLGISEREQRRIGHDLHDSLCQHLTGVALAGQVLEEKLTARRLPEAKDASKVVELVEEGIALSRKLAKGLHPIEMEADGLMQALEELAATNAELFKVSCHFECDSPVLIHDATVSGHLYRITQEAISNAVKHGKARHINICLETIDDGISLRVQDDGAGLPELPPKNAGMGLRIMAHRAGMIGATFSVRRQDSGGTVVSCILRQGNRSGNGLHEQA